MNDELQKALATILAKTTQAAETGVAFLSEQLPDVIRQLLLWHAAKSAITALFIVVAIVLGVRFIRLCYAKMREDDWDEFSCVMGMIFCGVGVVFGAFVAAGAGLTLVQILLAPKIFLIEYAASLVK